jgi:hypothetical protein
VQAEALWRDGHDAHGNLAANQVSDHGSRTSIRDLHDLGNAGDGLEEFARQMIGGADADVSVRNFPRITFGVPNKLIEGLGRHRRMHRDAR